MILILAIQIKISIKKIIYETLYNYQFVIYRIFHLLVKSFPE